MATYDVTCTQMLWNEQIVYSQSEKYQISLNALCSQYIVVDKLNRFRKLITLKIYIFTAGIPY